MQGLLAAETETASELFGVKAFRDIARDAYAIAEAMIIEASLRSCHDQSKEP